MNRYETPPITLGPSLIEALSDRIALFDPESPGYIDAFIRQLRREWRKPKKKWWQF